MRNENCLKCNLANNCKTVCLWGKSYGSEKPRLMVVTDFPTEVEDKFNVLDGSGKDKFVVQIISKVLKENEQEIYRTNLMKCRPSGVEPTTENMENCYEYLIDEIFEIKPTVILVLGQLASNFLLNDKAKIEKMRGTVNKKTFVSAKGDQSFETTMICTYAPAFVDAQKSDAILNNFGKDIKMAYDIAVDKEEVIQKSNTTLCMTGKDVADLIGYIKQTGEVFFDFETAGNKDVSALEYYSEETIITVMSFSFQHGSSFVVPIDHFDSPFKGEDRDRVLEVLKKHVFQNPEIRKGAHNTKFDKLFARKYGIELRGQVDDSMLLHHLFNEIERHGLKEVTSKIWSPYTGYEDEVKKYKWEEVPLRILADYAGIDTDLGFRLLTLMESKISEDSRLYRLYRNLTMFSMKALADAEYEGMLVDRENLEKYIDTANKYADEQELKLRNYKEVRRFEASERERITAENLKQMDAKLKAANERFKGKRTKTVEALEEKIRNVKAGTVSLYDGINFGSYPQLGALLYTKEGFGYDEVYDKKKKKVCRTTDKGVISQFDDYSGFIEDLFFWRSLQKTISTYLVGILERLDRKDRVHTSFLLHGTASGRLSSQNPNLQNLPNKDRLKNPVAKEVVGYVKSSFIAPPGHKIAQVDYGQAELRIAAEFAGEETMLGVYERGEDIHALTAATMMRISLEDFYKLDKLEQKNGRFKAKAVNFGLIYGMSAEGLQEYARVSYGVIMTLDEAVEARNAYFTLYPRLLYFHELYIQKAVKFGYVRTLFGRKRICPDIYDDDDYIRSFSERIAINSPVQGTAGEFTILALGLLRNRLDPRVKFVNTIHDSIIFYIPDEILDDTLRMIKYTCENLDTEPYFGKKLERVQMQVDIELSDISWNKMEEYFLK